MQEPSFGSSFEGKESGKGWAYNQTINSEDWLFCGVERITFTADNIKLAGFVNVSVAKKPSSEDVRLLAGTQKAAVVREKSAIVVALRRSNTSTKKTTSFVR